MADDRCIIVTGFGYAPTYKNFHEWVTDDIQDWEAAINVAESMIDAHPDSYPYNEGEPEFYTEFNISNMDEFTMQLNVSRKLLED
jgi:hypothetical protein